ncbi:hypothetical protein TNCV_698721 [Trichonephila clavipes]|nr:hypothetical protein TNCV_698721 [Trichonephila clavipes]
MGTTNHHRKWGRKLSLVEVIRKNNNEGCDFEYNEKWCKGLLPGDASPSSYRSKSVGKKRWMTKTNHDKSNLLLPKIIFQDKQTVEGTFGVI